MADICCISSHLYDLHARYKLFDLPSYIKGLFFFLYFCLFPKRGSKKEKGLYISEYFMTHPYYKLTLFARVRSGVSLEVERLAGTSKSNLFLLNVSPEDSGKKSMYLKK